MFIFKYVVRADVVVCCCRETIEHTAGFTEMRANKSAGAGAPNTETRDNHGQRSVAQLAGRWSVLRWVCRKLFVGRRKITWNSVLPADSEVDPRSRMENAGQRLAIFIFIFFFLALCTPTKIVVENGTHIIHEEWTNG